MPSWLLPSALPQFVVKGTIRHMPGLDERMAGFRRANERRATTELRIPKIFHGKHWTKRELAMIQKARAKNGQ